MAKFDKIAVLNKIGSTGMVPVFYHKDAEIAKKVVKACYDIAENLGFKQGNILEPSCGIGNFIGMKPKSMADSKVYGIELDSVSAAIAQQLYQTTSIVNNGYEKVDLPDNFYDLVTTNVPFGDFKVSDKKYDKHNPLIHDYFFMKSLDKVRTGGIMILITSKGTMDKETAISGDILLKEQTFSVQ